MWLGYTILVINYIYFNYILNPIVITSILVLNYNHLSRDFIFSTMRSYCVYTLLCVGGPLTNLNKLLHTHILLAQRLYLLTTGEPPEFLLANYLLPKGGSLLLIQVM